MFVSEMMSMFYVWSDAVHVGTGFGGKEVGKSDVDLLGRTAAD
jgi:hypothetical protein